MPITNFSDAQNALRPYYDYSHTMFNTDIMRQLMAYLGNPQNELRVLHIAGTSGKTSTAYYCAAMLQAAGKTVGLSVSPHVDALNERVQVNGQPLPEAEFCSVLDEFLELIKRAPVKPSYFEIMTALAYWQFNRLQLDYAVIEVGLGGRLDASNVIDRADKVCLITDIGLDHTEILGDTLAKIATEKAGIIQPQNTVFMYEQGAEVMSSIGEQVQRQHAGLHRLQPTDQVTIASLPGFQQRNLGLARQAVDYALTRDGHASVTSQQLQQAAAITVPARLERFTVNGKTVITDGSHNQQKLQALCSAIRQLYPDQSIAVLAGFVQGNAERWQGGLEELLSIANHVTLTGFVAESDLPKTSVNPAELASYCDSKSYQNYTVIVDPKAALESTLKRPDSIVLVTGSFYLLNHIRPLILKQL